MKDYLTKSITKEYLWSAFITFATAFFTAILPNLGGLPPEQGAIFAIIMVGIRAGVRAIINLLATGGSTASSR